MCFLPFPGLDFDGDGGISVEEFDAFGHVFNKDWSLEKSRKTVQIMDADGNGTVERGEFVAYYLELLKNLDDAQFQAGVDKMQNAIQADVGSQTI